MDWISTDGQRRISVLAPVVQTDHFRLVVYKWATRRKEWSVMACFQLNGEEATQAFNALVKSRAIWN